MLACDPPHGGAGGVDISTFILPQTLPPELLGGPHAPPDSHLAEPEEAP